MDVITTLDGELKLEYKGQSLEFKRFDEMPYQKNAKETLPDLKVKENEGQLKRRALSNKNLFRTVKSRGYFEREEIMSPEERAAAVISLEKMRQDARKDNLEILEERRNGTNG